MKNIKIHIFIVFFFLINASCSNPQKSGPYIENGFLDLSSWNFEEDGLVNLNGDWEFYWEKLLDSKDFESDNSIKAEYINVPGGWARQEGKSYPELGYATYRLNIKVPEKQTDYNFIFMSIFASARMWVNGTLCLEKGEVASNKELSKPEFITEYYSPIKYDSDRDTLELIIQVADFSYGGPAAGLRRKVVFGPETQINTERIKSGSINALLIGISLLIAIYHIFLFLYRRNEFSYLIFAMLSIVLAIWTIYTSGMSAGSFTFQGYLRFGSIGPSFFSPLIVLFYYFIYRDEVHKKAVFAFIVIGIVFGIIHLTASPITTSRILIIYSMNVLIPPAYLLGYSLLKALIRRRQGSVLSFLGVLIVYSSFIHDVLLTNGYISGFGKYISSEGFVALIMMQSLVLAQMFSLTYRKNIDLKENLETQVEKKTRSINKQKAELERRNQDLIKRNKKIKSQRKLLSQKNEEVQDSLNYAKKIQSAILPPEQYFQEILNDVFILFKPKDIVSGDFYWIRQVRQYVILAAADCTGHGVPGAFMSMLGMSYLNEIVTRREITNANEVLNELRKQIRNSLRQHGQPEESKDGIDMALCVIDEKEKELQYCGANRPLYLIRDDNGTPELKEFKSDPMPLGYYQGKFKAFTTKDIKLEFGDVVYLFSDGFVDQKGGEEGKKYLSKNFKSLLMEIYAEPMKDQQMILDAVFSEWKGDNPQVDDVLVIGVRI
jgi:serine phosphatase RsbU (regulator of sigma subunit)